MHHIFFTPSCVDGHLGWFLIVAVVNSAAINIIINKMDVYLCVS